MRISARRPAPATLISLVALGVAMGGTSYAAATIGTAQLEPNAVTSAKIKNGTQAMSFRDAGAPADPAVKADVDGVHRANPGPGGTVVQASQQGTGGVQAVQWQLAGVDAQGDKHVATVWTSAGAVGTGCNVSAQALATV